MQKFYCLKRASDKLIFDLTRRWCLFARAVMLSKAKHLWVLLFLLVYRNDQRFFALLRMTTFGAARLRIASARSLQPRKLSGLERVTRVELATFSLATRRSTTELHPHFCLPAAALAKAGEGDK
jgi:hypothetical protein